MWAISRECCITRIWSLFLKVKENATLEVELRWHSGSAVGVGVVVPALRGTRKPVGEEREEWVRDRPTDQPTDRPTERLRQEGAAQEARVLKTEYTGFKKWIPFPIHFVFKAQFNKRERGVETQCLRVVSYSCFKKNNLKIAHTKRKQRYWVCFFFHWKATLIRREKRIFKQLICTR